MRIWSAGTPEETEAVGEELARELRPDGVLLLDGDLGAGKTVLVRGLARGLGIAADEVQSPSYTLMREHEAGDTLLIHVDLYRLSPTEAAGIGLEEVLNGPGVKAVEWPDRMEIPVANATRIRITRRSDGRRDIVERPPGELPPAAGAYDSRTDSGRSRPGSEDKG